MALWGNNDAVGSGSTVTLDYDNKVVSGWAGTATGVGATFGQIGAAKTGDIISFGQHGSGTYFGEAVIVSIASSLQCTIASTEALSGAAIAGVEFTVSEKPVYTLGDPTYNIKRDSSPSYNTLTTGTADQATGIGSHSVGTDISELLANDLEVGDYLVNNSVNVPIIAIGIATAAGIATCITGDKVFRAEPPDFVAPNVGSVTVGLGTTRPVVNQVGFVTADVGGAGIAVGKGSSVIPVKEILTYHLMVGDVVNIGAAITNVQVHSIGHTAVSLASTTPVNINVGTMVSFSSSSFNVFASAGANNDETIAIGDSITYRGAGGADADVIDLGQNLTAAISADDTLTFKRRQAGYDAYVYGVASGGVDASEGTQFETGVGWVGVTTYMDNDNNLRVKKEILVAMSGISTGNSPAYPDMN
jgi:hypothetical protein|tara:strand:+ start:716 stop:1966 length:1251 start_codon:yes stop_codon:yes gene_type:complete